MDKDKEKGMVQAALKDPESFGLIFDDYYPKILKFVIKRTGGHLQNSQDITAEVFFKAYKNLWQFKWKGINFGAWLYKIATNEANNYFKKGKKASFPTAFMEELEHLSPGHNSAQNELIILEDGKELQQDIQKLYAAVHNLPIKYQEVIALRYFEDKSILEICEILGKKSGTVKSLISRGIDLLEKQMQPKDGDSVIQVEAKLINSHEQTGD